MVGALLTQVNPVALLGKYPQLAKVAKNNISVDIPAGELPAWVTLAQRVQHAKITSLPFTSSNINVVHPDFTKIRAMVTGALTASDGPAPATRAVPRQPQRRSRQPRPTPARWRTSEPRLLNG